MPDITAALDFMTAHPWAGWLALGLLSLVASRKSQVDAWAEKNPRVAGFMKLLRSLGVDPWLFVQSLSLLVRGRLPAAKVAVPAKDDSPPTPRSGSVPPSGPASAAVALLLAGSLALSGATACSPAATPEARGAQVVDVVRASLNTGAAIVGALDTVNAAWMDAVTATGDSALAAAAVPAGRKATAAVNAAYAALSKAQAALDGGDDAGARAYLVEALGYADLAISLLDTGGQGNRVPKASRDALEFLHGVAARWTGGAS